MLPSSWAGHLNETMNSSQKTIVNFLWSELISISYFKQNANHLMKSFVLNFQTDFKSIFHRMIFPTRNIIIYRTLQLCPKSLWQCDTHFDSEKIFSFVCDIHEKIHSLSAFRRKFIANFSFNAENLRKFQNVGQQRIAPHCKQPLEGSIAFNISCCWCSKPSRIHSRKSISWKIVNIFIFCHLIGDFLIFHQKKRSLFHKSKQFLL